MGLLTVYSKPYTVVGSSICLSVRPVRHHVRFSPRIALITVSLYHCITVSLYHCITVSLYHCITISLYNQLPTVWNSGRLIDAIPLLGILDFIQVRRDSKLSIGANMINGAL